MVLLTDEQTGVDPVEVSASVPQDVPMYTFNLAGYRVGHAPSGGRNRFAFGGLNDASFGVLGLLEDGRNAQWPWVK